MRAISCEINLIVLLFLLEGCHLDHAATLVPNSEASDQLAGVPMHPVLRFAISSALLLASSLVQFLVRWVLWERCVKDRLWQFVDLLAVTNISCLLLEEPNFGFYLHGRSVHDHADADMAQLNAHLKREEEGLEMLRGFRQDSHIQTFEICDDHHRSDRMRFKPPLPSKSQSVRSPAGADPPPPPHLPPPPPLPPGGAYQTCRPRCAKSMTPPLLAPTSRRHHHRVGARPAETRHPATTRDTGGFVPRPRRA